MTSWKNRLRRMLFLHKLEPLVIQTPKVAEFTPKSATAERSLHTQPSATSHDDPSGQEPLVLGSVDI